MEGGGADHTRFERATCGEELARNAVPLFRLFICVNKIENAL